MDIQQLMAVDAVAVGPYDLTAGIDFLLAAGSKGFPWLSANIVDRNRAPLFAPSLTITRSGIDIGILGLTGSNAPLPQGTHLADWREILPRQLQDLKRSSAMVIILSSLSSSENLEMIRLYPEIDILITADRSQGNIPPTITGGTLMTQTQSQGRYLGQLIINWQPGYPWGHDLSQDQARLQQQLGIIERRLLRVERRKNTSTNIDPEYIRRLEREKEEITKQLDGIVAQQEKMKTGESPLNRYTHSFIGLSSNLQNEPRVTDKINRVKASIAASHLRRQTGESPVCK
ncbi:hypothetical protein JWG42_01985 [Desulfoprunum benzoelyticum]|uniref:2',3'-cyclic-nucleotide 2'-phosphodiesterase (5'-nucleotidase family) n=1 Tax=Desulfoprunum benzoelyticum TaxID=1506996 RepID=A0A840UYM8_9BACT|nr:hypothetical protein [Desulfoprunum benzoelyticum]MBB5346549.1 2',3'-cyclic-nucleotide 2'-phosphodiesterase (5'-nucleotidase family) [Desulfoprunum benzoelyticum]MBM9528922.1 hypothetical protein [Desulfoprunum benzoelyticum]